MFDVDPRELYGAIKANLHVAGYTLERAFADLEPLLQGDGWKLCGSGFTNINDFMRSIPLDSFKAQIEQRKRIVQRIKQLQPAASNRAIADMLGVREGTIRNDRAQNCAPDHQTSNENSDVSQAAAQNYAPSLDGAEAARAVQRAEESADRKAKKEQRKQEIAMGIFSSDGPFGTVVIDPPWEVEKIDRHVRPNQHQFDYPTMNVEELLAFWIRDLAPRLEPHCHVFMWTTPKWLPAAISFMEPIGFRYVLTMVWHKAGGFQPIDLPQYNCEFIVYARRGIPLFVDTKDFFLCFEAPRREHSRKPDAFYDVVRRVTGGSRIDVFSREPREGYAQFGNEPERFGDLE